MNQNQLNDNLFLAFSCVERIQEIMDCGEDIDKNRSRITDCMANMVKGKVRGAKTLNTLRKQLEKKFFELETDLENFHAQLEKFDERVNA